MVLSVRRQESSMVCMKQMPTALFPMASHLHSSQIYKSKQNNRLKAPLKVVPLLQRSPQKMPRSYPRLLGHSSCDHDDDDDDDDDDDVDNDEVIQHK